MRKTLSLALAKAHLSECIRDVEHGAILITKHGKAVAALVPAEDMAHLERLRRIGPEGGLASLAGGWEGADELIDIIRLTTRTGPRPQQDSE